MSGYMKGTLPMLEPSFPLHDNYAYSIGVWTPVIPLALNAQIASPCLGKRFSLWGDRLLCTWGRNRQKSQEMRILYKVLQE